MDLIKQYSFLADKYRQMADKEERKLLRLSILRLITFFGGLVAVYLGFLWSVPLGVLISIIFVALFVFLLRLFSEKSLAKNRLVNLEKINLDETKAIRGDYSHFCDGLEYVNPSHDFSYDIDVFGKGSLFQSLNRTVTGFGKDTLAAWLSNPYEESHNLVNRQAIVNELTRKFDWRQEFLAQGTGKSLGQSDIEGIDRWLRDDTTKHLSKLQKMFSLLLPCITLIMLALLIFGVVHYSSFVILVLINFYVVYSNIKNTNKIHNNLSGRYMFLESLSCLLDLVEKEHLEGILYSEIDRQNRKIAESSGVEALKQLSKITGQFDNRMNFLINIIFNGLFLWDFHCLRRLEEWKRQYSDSFSHWLKLVGEVDAFVSLANYAYNNPDFVYPAESTNGEYFAAKSLGHPLINCSYRVCNDFSINSKGSICIVTGANMAGKSTFLRTVAVNYILAMIGVPVCAKELKFRSVCLFTSMRTTDSLHSNESYFYAELKRLKVLGERFETCDALFFILDEILKGTNSDDKRLGSILFLKKMIALHGTGMIATHDTSLGDMENDYPDVIFNKCIEIEVDGANIKFDYKLQGGIAKNKNAVILMKRMGLLN